MRSLRPNGSLVVVALLFIGGCAESPSARLVGTWNAELAAAPGPEASLKEKLVHAFTKDAFAVRFGEDQRVDFIAGGKTVTSGVWRFIRTEGDSSIVEVKLDGTNTATQERITWVATDQIKWRPPHMAVSLEPLTFRRTMPKPQ